MVGPGVTISAVPRFGWESHVVISVMTRPDIVEALRACACHSHNPSPRHWKALLQVAAYVNATKEIGLRLVRSSSLRLCTNRRGRATVEKIAAS